MPRKSTPRDFWKHVDCTNVSNCWPWKIALTKAGYGRIRYHQKEWKASRLAWMLTYGDPGNLNVLHACDNPRCCNPTHLFLGTHQDNMQDMVAKGRHPRNKAGYLPHGDQHHSHLRPEVVARGEHNGSSVLTAGQVMDIRRKYTQGMSSRRLANEYGVVKSNILFIVHRKTWKHLDQAIRELVP